jgi:hypothetical protein
MVPDQFAAAESEDGRTPDQACSLLLLLLAESHLTRHLSGSMLRRMEALPLPVKSTRQPGKTNLEDGGELRKGYLINSFEMGQIMAF